MGFTAFILLVIEFIRSSSKGIVVEESSLVNWCSLLFYYSLLLLPLELVVAK